MNFSLDQLLDAHLEMTAGSFLDRPERLGWATLLFSPVIVPEQRGNWLWKKASCAALTLAKNGGGRFFLAQTETGSSNEKLYVRAGMTCAGTSKCFILGASPL